MAYSVDGNFFFFSWRGRQRFFYTVEKVLALNGDGDDNGGGDV